MDAYRVDVSRFGMKSVASWTSKALRKVFEVGGVEVEMTKVEVSRVPRPLGPLTWRLTVGFGGCRRPKFMHLPERPRLSLRPARHRTRYETSLNDDDDNKPLAGLSTTRLFQQSDYSSQRTSRIRYSHSIASLGFRQTGRGEEAVLPLLDRQLHNRKCPSSLGWVVCCTVSSGLRLQVGTLTVGAMD